MPWPSMKATMSSFRVPRSSGRLRMSKAALYAYGLSAVSYQLSGKSPGAKLFWVGRFLVLIDSWQLTADSCFPVLDYFFHHNSRPNTHAAFERICGLPGPRNGQKTGRLRIHRNQISARGYGKGACGDAGGSLARRPH